MNLRVKIILKTVIDTLFRNINILKRIKLIHKNVCLGNQQEYLMKN